MKALIHIYGHDELCLQIDNYRSMLRGGLTFKDVFCALGVCSDLYEISLECLDFQTYGTNGCSLTLEGTKEAIRESVDLVHSDLGLEVLCNGTTVWALDDSKTEHVWKTFCDRMPSRLHITWAQGAVKPQTLLQLNLVAGGVKISYIPMWQQYSPELNAVTVYGADLNTSDCATLLRDKYFLENITRIESVAAANDEGESIFMCPIKELQITHVRKELCVAVSEEVVADYNKVARYSTIQKKDGQQEWLVDKRNQQHANVHCNDTHANGTCVTLSELGPVCTLELDTYQVKLLKRLLRQCIDYDDSYKDNEDIVAEKLLRKLEQVH